MHAVVWRDSLCVTLGSTFGGNLFTCENELNTVAGVVWCDGDRRWDEQAKRCSDNTRKKINPTINIQHSLHLLMTREEKQQRRMLSKLELNST
jgi:hypothetical protein